MEKEKEFLDLLKSYIEENGLPWDYTEQIVNLAVVQIKEKRNLLLAKRLGLIQDKVPAIEKIREKIEKEVEEEAEEDRRDDEAEEVIEEEPEKEKPKEPAKNNEDKIRALIKSKRAKS